ncbi:unnamed protein product [Notodromas monacha]|uniref:RGS domain-containing protein n=1 Tax=Notodromas monacha TaxID=399045 RepID=A0A7R9GE71_9CRUS|nr:unnamed protein product [Notodromas monacha]CAG0917573.1 unnamed protein product [Notodromas monacha]
MVVSNWLNSLFHTNHSEFLAHGAPCEVNIDSKTLDWTVNMLKSHTNPPRIIFNKAQMHVFHLLTKDCYPRFVRSEYYKNLLAAAQQAGQRRRMFGFGPSSKKKTSGVDGGGSSSSSGGPGGSSGGGVGGSLSAGGSSGAGAAAAAAAGTSSSAVTSSAASAGLSRNSSDKTLKGSAVAASSSAAGIGCIASIIEQDRRLSHSHSTSDLRKIDASASLGSDDVCPWDETALSAPPPPPPPAAAHPTDGNVKKPPVLRALTTDATAADKRPPAVQLSRSTDVCPWDDSQPGPTPGSAGPAQTEVCPWDTHDGDGHSTATPATTGAVYSASCIEMQHLASGSASLPKSAQSPCQALSRINTPAKGSPGKDPYAGGGQGCDVCPWDSSGSPVPTVDDNG